MNKRQTAKVKICDVSHPWSGWGLVCAFLMLLALPVSGSADPAPAAPPPPPSPLSSFVGKMPSEGGGDSFLNNVAVLPLYDFMGRRGMALREVMDIEYRVERRGRTIAARFGATETREGWEFMTLAVTDDEAYGAICLEMPSTRANPEDAVWRVILDGDMIPFRGACSLPLETVLEKLKDMP